MAEAKTAESKTAAKAAPKVAPQVELQPAGEATDPAVHQLLAELETARVNGAEDDMQDLIDYLADLGYSAS
jgi:hypothetical protein